MALGPRLELRQGQSLVITPPLPQAIKLLQLSNLELEAFVEAELARNPLLQRDVAKKTTIGSTSVRLMPRPIHASIDVCADAKPPRTGGAGLLTFDSQTLTLVVERTVGPIGP